MPREDAYSDAERIRYWWAEERRLLLAALASVAPPRRDEPLGEGAWSAREIAAHRLFWEAQEREALEQYLNGREPQLLRFPVKRIDAANAAAVESLRNREFDALVRALARLRARSEALAAQIPDADLEQPKNAARILLGVALEHDREHRREIATWVRMRN